MNASKIGPLATGLLLFRRESGLSQEKFAKRAALGPTTVKRYESGAAAPSDTTIERVAAGFALRPSEVLLKCARLCAAEEKRQWAAAVEEKTEPPSLDPHALVDGVCRTCGPADAYTLPEHVEAFDSLHGDPEGVIDPEERREDERESIARGLGGGDS